MNVAFRVDASSAMGTGHFRRCLALADGLRQCGARVRFLSRHLPDHLRVMLDGSAYEFARLPSGEEGADDVPHARWLGVTQAADAEAALAALSPAAWDW